MALVTLYIILAVFFLVFGALKVRLAAHSGEFLQLVLAAVSVGLVAPCIWGVVDHFSACSCGGPAEVPQAVQLEAE